jgi:tetratricopeptide (TPR) repeat protein
MGCSKIIATFLILVSLATVSAEPLRAEQPSAQPSRKLLFTYPNATDLAVYYEGKTDPIAAVQGKLRIISEQVDPADVTKVTLLVSAYCLIVIANGNRAKSDYVEAAKHYEMAIDVADKASPDNEIGDLARLRLAGLYLKTKKSAEAEQLYKHWLEKNSSQSASISDQAAVLDNLSQALLQQKKLTEAEQYNLQSTAMYQKISPVPLRDIAECLNNLALIQIKQHKCTEAEANVKEAIKITEELGDARGRAIKYDTLASTYYCRKLFKEALQAHQKALAMMEQTFGPNHPECAICLQSIARCYMEMRDWANAITYLQRAFKIVLDTQGSGSPACKEITRDIDLCLGQKLKSN